MVSCKRLDRAGLLPAASATSTRVQYGSWWSALPHVSAVSVTVSVLLSLLMVIAPSGEGAKKGELCPLVKNGRLRECKGLINRIFTYTDKQLNTACKQADVQAGPQCLKRIVEECRDMGYGDPAQTQQLHNATLQWQNKFDNICATVLELHQSKGTASFISSCSPHWHPATWLPPLSLLLLAICLPAL